MGQATGYMVLDNMNKLFNELGDEKAVELIEQYLDALVAGETLTRWRRNKPGCGWVVYAPDNPDGIYINWNDTSQASWPRKIETEEDES